MLVGVYVYIHMSVHLQLSNNILDKVSNVRVFTLRFVTFLVEGFKFHRSGGRGRGTLGHPCWGT